MDYSQEIKNGVGAKIIVPEDIYDFRGSDVEELLGNFYAFCRENLEIQSKQEPISPNIFLFTNSFEVNARAGLIHDSFVILINLGLFQSCVANYRNNIALAEHFQAIYPDSISKYDNPVNILAFQICTQFSYYHELAHLFQISGRNEEINIQERNEMGNQYGYDQVKHILEINADTYATISVFAHIEQYIERTFKENVTYENTMETFIFFSCCLLNYTLNFSAKPEQIYFDEYDHPHSFLRQLNVGINIVHHVGHSPYFKKAGVALDSSMLLRSVIDVYKELEAKGVFKTNITGIIDQSKELIRKMADYLYFLIQFNTKDYKNAMDVWNKGATS